MHTATILAKKRDGHSLTDAEIAYLIHGFVAGSVSDDQMAAFAMAVCIQGMSPAETAALTDQMLHSGEILKWDVDQPIVDKHSTGGVGDKVSIILAPLLACENVIVPMISGRGLGTTGGTLDKLEAIPGFRTDLSLTEIQQTARQVGCVITGASAEIAPADRRLYALRDVTGTVESIPLITASIMSKKLAAGLQALVLDVKCGNGAFMQDLESARALANSLVETGKRMNVKTAAIITDMNQPLGRLCGNAVEIDECVSALKGEGPRDLVEVTLELGGDLLVLSGVAEDISAGRRKLQAHLDSGRAMAKLEEMVAAQGGDLNAKRPRATQHAITAQNGGVVTAIDTRGIGSAIIAFGGGRKVKTDKIDPSVGIEMLVRLGEMVFAGQPLMNVFADQDGFERVKRSLADAMQLGEEPMSPPLLIVEKMGLEND